MDWFYAKHGKQEGPVTLAVLKAKFESGEIVETDLVWREGMAEWLGAGNVPELAAAEAAPTEVVPSNGDSGLGTPVGPQVVGGQQALTQPAAGLAAGAVPPTPGLAIASLVCGILAVVLSCCGVGLFSGIAAVICGHIQMGRYKENPEVEIGKGLVTAGLITGYIGIAMALGWGVLNLIGVASS